MLIAILSDIHSNYLALESVLKDIKKEKPDKIFCLGDIIGYGPMPNECVESIKENNIDFVYGNHEVAFFYDFMKDIFSSLAKKSIEWTRENLKNENKIFLSKYIDMNNFRNDLSCMNPRGVEKDLGSLKLTHSSYPEPYRFRYLKKDFENVDYFFDIKAKDAFNQFNSELDLLFIGHTHESCIFYREKERCEDSSYENKFSGSYKLNSNYNYIINVGSVGQPRDHDVRACYVLYNTYNRKLEYKRVEYNHLESFQKTIELGLPKELGYRLLLGR